MDRHYRGRGEWFISRRVGVCRLRCLKNARMIDVNDEWCVANGGRVNGGVLLRRQQTGFAAGNTQKNNHCKGGGTNEGRKALAQNPSPIP
jgi:hypothetical protein